MPRPETSQTVLLVEDDAIIALAQRALLQEHGYSVLTAATGAAAVETALGNDSVDLVLMDIDLGPGMDGTEAAASILEGRDVPIVFLTNHSEKEMVDKVKGITQYGYVLKYSGEFVLLETIRMALELFWAHKEAESSRDLYRSIVRLSGEIVIRHAPDQRWVFVNRAACEFWGKTSEELLATGHLSFVHPEDRSATEEMTRKMAETREPVWGFVNRQQTPRGWRTVEWNRAPIIDESGNLAGYQASGRDITERLSAMELYRQQQAAREAILTNMAEVVAIIDRDGINRYKSPNVEREFGWKPRDLVGISAFEFVHPEDVPRIQSLFAEILQETPGKVSNKCRYRRADGGYRWISFTAENKLDDPALGGVLLTYRDIDDEEKSRDDLETTRSQLQAMFDFSPTGIILADSGNNIVDANPTAAQLFGFNREELVGMNGRELIHPDDLAEKPPEEMTEAAETADIPISVENRFRRKDGSYFHASVWLSRFSAPGHRATHLLQFQEIPPKKVSETEV